MLGLDAGRPPKLPDSHPTGHSPQDRHTVMNARPCRRATRKWPAGEPPGAEDLRHAALPRVARRRGPMPAL